VSVLLAHARGSARAADAAFRPRMLKVTGGGAGALALPSGGAKRSSIVR